MMEGPRHLPLSTVVLAVVCALLCWASSTSALTCPAPLDPKCTCDGGNTTSTKTTPAIARCEDKGFTTLPVPAQSEVATLKSTVGFFFDNNKITAITSGTYYWAGLFSLKNNTLTSISDNAFALFSKLLKLDLSSNLLTTVRKEMFAGLTRMKWLYLTSNKLTTLRKDMFDGLTSLRYLYLETNQIKVLEADSFCGNCLPVLNLWELRLTGNPLADIKDDTFNSTLWRLYLSSCSLKVINERTFAGLTDLQELYLDHNQLTSIHPKSMDVTTFDSSFNTLHLQSNQLTSLSKDTFPRNWLFVKLKLKLGDNPWKCDCNLTWMVTVLAISPTLKNVRCASPANLKDKVITEVTKEEWGCKTIINGGVGKQALSLGITIPLVIMSGMLSTLGPI